MLKIKVGTTTSRKEIVVSGAIKIKDMLSENNIDFQAATIMLNGQPLSGTELNKTLTEAGIEDGDYLLSVVKAMNANFVEMPVGIENPADAYQEEVNGIQEEVMVTTLPEPSEEQKAIAEAAERLAVRLNMFYPLAATANPEVVVKAYDRLTKVYGEVIKTML